MKSRFVQIICWLWLVIWGVVARIASAVDMPIPLLRPPHDEISPTFWETYHWQIVGAILACLGIVGLSIFLARRPRAIVVEPPASIARRSLEALRGRPADGALVVEVSRVLRRYLRTALSFPPDEITTTELRQALQNHPQVAPELAAATGDFLRRCDEWKFAPNEPVPQADVVQNAADLVEKIEEARQPQPRTEAGKPVTA